MKLRLAQKLSSEELNTIRKEAEQNRATKKCHCHCPECGKACLNTVEGHNSQHQCGKHSWS